MRTAELLSVEDEARWAALRRARACSAASSSQPSSATPRRRSAPVRARLGARADHASTVPSPRRRPRPRRRVEPRSVRRRDARVHRPARGRPARRRRAPGVRRRAVELVRRDRDRHRVRPPAPWKARTELLDSAIEREREIIYVDLTQDPERMWRESFTHAARKNVKRARRGVYSAASEADVRELHRIYTLTMDRQGASERHNFRTSTSRRSGSGCPTTRGSC